MATEVPPPPGGDSSWLVPYGATPPNEKGFPPSDTTHYFDTPRSYFVGEGKECVPGDGAAVINAALSPS